jgi:hypothetical protein
MSQGSPRHPAEEADFNQRAGCTSSWLATSSLKERAGEDDETLQWTLYQKQHGPDKIDRSRRPA